MGSRSSDLRRNYEFFNLTCRGAKKQTAVTGMPLSETSCFSVTNIRTFVFCSGSRILLTLRQPGFFTSEGYLFCSRITVTFGYVLEMTAITSLRATFPRYGETIPEISFPSGGIAHQITDWHDCENYSTSDHQAILFKVLSEQESLDANSAPLPRRWNVCRLD
ncbi:hypothetical protein J6590_098897 [Homalodisca vitripennis]|nr:hypothetical protein J6590_098897 [Homalodisca vitripennis]